MTYKEIIKKVAADMGETPTFVNRVYSAYWRAIKEHVESLPLKQELTEEEFDSLRPSVNIAGIGKLNVTYDRHVRIYSGFVERNKK